MTVNGGEWLRKLTGMGAARGIGAAGGAPGPAAPASGTDAAAFAALLSKVQGQGGSGPGPAEGLRSVTVDKGVPISLTESQALRVARAVDRASAEGFAQAAVQVDGMNLLVDVEGRRVTGVLDASHPAAQIDGVVVAEPEVIEPDPGANPGTPSPQASAEPARLLRGADALRMLTTPAAAQARAHAGAEPLAGAA